MSNEVFGPNFFSVTVAAQIVHASEGSIKGEIRAGRLKATVMPGNRMFWTISPADLATWYRALSTEVGPRAAKINKEIGEVCRSLGIERPALAAEGKIESPARPEPGGEPKKKVAIL